MSSPPGKYVRNTNFTDFSTVHPDEQQSGVGLDIEFDGLKSTTDQLIDRLGQIQRSDGALGNLTVSLDSLSSAVRALLGSAAGAVRGAWLTGTLYAARDLVSQGTFTYICVTTHTSGVFSTDLAAGDWLIFSTNVNALSLTRYSITDPQFAGGAVADSVVADTGITNGTTSFKDTVNAPFTITMVGRTICFDNFSGTASQRRTISAYVSASEVTLSSAASGSGTNAHYCVFGTDNTAVFQAAATSGKEISVPNLSGIFKYGSKKFEFPNLNNGNEEPVSKAINWQGESNAAVIVGHPDTDYIATSFQFGQRSDAAQLFISTFITLKGLAFDVSFMSNATDGTDRAAIAIEDAFWAYIENPCIFDCRSTSTSNRWGILFGRSVFDAYVDGGRCERVNSRGSSAGPPAVNGNTTLFINGVALSKVKASFLNTLAVERGAFHGNTNKIDAVGVYNISVTGVDVEDSGALIYSDGASGNTHSVVIDRCTFNGFLGAYYGGTSGRPPLMQIRGFHSPQQPKSVVSWTRSANTMVLQFPTTLSGSVFLTMAPSTGSFVSGTDATSGSNLPGFHEIISHDEVKNPSAIRFPATGPASSSTANMSVTVDGGIGYTATPVPVGRGLYIEAANETQYDQDITFADRPGTACPGVRSRVNNGQPGGSSYSDMHRDVNGNLVIGDNFRGETYLTLAVGRAYVSGDVSFFPTAASSPVNNGELSFEFTSNTSVTWRLKGSDGTVRHFVMTMAP